MEAGSRIFKAPKNNRCLLFSLLKREMVYFLSTQDLFQVAEVNRTFPADYANTTQTGPFHVITTSLCVQKKWLLIQRYMEFEITVELYQDLD